MIGAFVYGSCTKSAAFNYSPKQESVSHIVRLKKKKRRKRYFSILFFKNRSLWTVLLILTDSVSLRHWAGHSGGRSQTLGWLIQNRQQRVKLLKLRRWIVCRCAWDKGPGISRVCSGVETTTCISLSLWGMSESASETSTDPRSVFYKRVPILRTFSN